MAKLSLRITRIIGALFIATAMLAFLSLSAQAAGVVGTGTPGSCTNNAYLAATSGGGTVTFNCGPGTTTIAASTVVVTNAMTIEASSNIVLDGSFTNQLFLVQPTGNLVLRSVILSSGMFGDGGCIYIGANSTDTGRATLESVAVTNCKADGVNDGGAIYNMGVLNVSDSIFSGNEATRNGGAIAIVGDSTTSIQRSTFVGNAAKNPSNDDDGGALWILTGTVDIKQSLIFDNSAERNGGGIYNSLGTLSVTNSTFYANSAEGGGGLFADGFSNTLLSSVTIADNSATTGGGLWRINNFAAVTLFNSIVADNKLADGVTDGLDCDGPPVNSGGFNLISDGTCVDGTVSSDQRNTNPMLGPLKDNGGYTYTADLLPGSPAIDKGTTAGCPAYDQRGMPRPLGAACDTGAVEAGTNAFLPAALKN